MKTNQQPLKVGIIGAGFSGTALAAALHRESTRPIDIILFDKTGDFGTGAAYQTPFFFHLLNVRARDMSAFEDDPLHFVNWLTQCPIAQDHLDKVLPINDQFVSRHLYGLYLKDILKTVAQASSRSINIQFEPFEVMDIIPAPHHAVLILNDKREIRVDKVVLALGNSVPVSLPFPISGDVSCISNPWDYAAPKRIPQQDPVLIVGTGLSMVDTVLTLLDGHHQGNIYAVSRHGLLPLPHADTKVPYMLMPTALPSTLLSLTAYIHQKSLSYIQEGGDWRSLINELRTHVPHLWAKLSTSDKRRFMRHVLPYWNIHRHRLHHHLSNVLTKLMAKKQLHVVSGRILAVENQCAKIKLRHSQEINDVPVKWIVNCLGPSPSIQSSQTLVDSLLTRRIAKPDVLDLGLVANTNGELEDDQGKPSSVFYTLGAMRKGQCWETIAVPEIRKQCHALAKAIVDAK